MLISLSARQKNVLQSIVHEYVQAATPVSSKVLAQGYQLGVSSATIRSEMAALEEGGFLTHPHTSAGRVPTEHGYRYYVENLMQWDMLPSAEQRMISHQFHQTRLELDQWLRLSAAVLAHSSQNASLVTAPKSGQAQLNHVDIVSIQETTVSVILGLQEGTLTQQILNLPQPVNRDLLNQTARQLTDLWRGLDVRDIKQVSSSLTGLSAQVSTIAIEIMERLDKRLSSDIYRDGLLNILNQPEFQDQQAVLQQVIRALEERHLIDQLISDVLEHGGIQIIVGGEGRWDQISQISVVLARYGVDTKMAGVMGVVGPMRMSYERSVSVVRYMSHLMSDLITDLYGK
ncbi:heat-inducible transcriptional repressor HrcA [Anaerolineales bacterium HSG24]|nr:heat-inducible transcriptional repressor HrcA [Anaerolineales bacterium HSG24]